MGIPFCRYLYDEREKTAAIIARFVLCSRLSRASIAALRGKTLSDRILREGASDKIMASHEKARWIECYWWLFLIAFGIACMLGVALWHPVLGG